LEKENIVEMKEKRENEEREKEKKNGTLIENKIAIGE
jgi:hypothetical protein